MEALREIAAPPIFACRYLLLYREVLAKDSAFSAWAWGYATDRRALFLPGKTQRSTATPRSACRRQDRAS